LSSPTPPRPRFTDGKNKKIVSHYLTNAWIFLTFTGDMQPTAKPSFISKQVLRGQYVFVDLVPRTDADLTLVCAGREECSPDYSIHRAGFRYHVVEYIVGGRWELVVDEQSHTLRAGSVFTYGPRTRYALRVLASPQPVKFFVAFTGRHAASLVKSAGLRDGVPRQVGQPRWLHDILDQILDGANLSRSAARRLGVRLTELLFLRLREDLRHPTEPTPESHRSYERCRQFIQENYLTLHTAEEIAHK
jgi:hypothetical protein